MKILIIEDEKEIADGIQAILAQEGYESDAVYDGENVLSGQVIGNASYEESISQQSLSRMYHAAPSKYKLGSYIFSKNLKQRKYFDRCNEFFVGEKYCCQDNLQSFIGSKRYSAFNCSFLLSFQICNRSCRGSPGKRKTVHFRCKP